MAAMERLLTMVLARGIRGKRAWQTRKVPVSEAGVVDEDVDAGEMLADFGDEIAHGLGIAHVADVKQDADAQLGDLFGGFFERLEFTAGDDEIAAFGRERAGKGQADAAAGSGDDGGAPGQAVTRRVAFTGAQLGQDQTPFERWRISDRNSERVSSSLRKQPSMEEVTASECCFSTPRIIMQRWRASMTTPTPWGSMTFWMVSAIWVVRRSWIWRRRENSSMRRGILLRPMTLPLGM